MVLPKLGLKGFDWTGVQNSTFVLRLKFIGKNPPRIKPRKRYLQSNSVNIKSLSTQSPATPATRNSKVNTSIILLANREREKTSSSLKMVKNENALDLKITGIIR